MEGAESDVSGFFAPILRRAGVRKQTKIPIIQPTALFDGAVWTFFPFSHPPL